MPKNPLLSDKARLITVVWLLLCTGFLATTLISYFASRSIVRASITETELPLTSDNIYSEIQKDLIRPVLISSMMARDTFLRDWVLSGEADTGQITRYLKEIMSQYGAVTSFFVSENSRSYFSTSGILKQVVHEEARDAWYFRVREMAEPYEINVDPDLANRDALTIFINYRVYDYQKRFIGATGVGLTVDAVNRMISDYQKRYGRTIFLVDAQGKITLSGTGPEDANGSVRRLPSSIRDIEGLRDQADTILKAGHGSFEYSSEGHRHFLNVRYIPELKWHLFVIKPEEKALNEIQRALYINLLMCLIITALVLTVVHLSINRYQRRLEAMARTDSLTGLANRHALDILLEQQIREIARRDNPMSAIMFDIDHFKLLNDSRGHLAGDKVLKEIATTLRNKLRASDIACRWGGEEFLLILPDTDLVAATRVAGTLRESIEGMAFDYAGESIRTTVSAGVAIYRKGENGEGFISRTDALLYQAKHEGRNRVCSEILETIIPDVPSDRL